MHSKFNAIMKGGSMKVTTPNGTNGTVLGLTLSVIEEQQHHHHQEEEEKEGMMIDLIN